MITSQLSFSFVKPSFKDRLARAYFSLIDASRLLAQIFTVGFSLLRLIFWRAVWLIVSLPEQIRTGFSPKKNGSLPVSQLFREVFENKRLKPAIGLSLVALCFMANFFSLQASAFNVSEEPVVLEEPKEVLITTKTTFRMPVPGYISTVFSWYHPGVDIAGNDNRLIYAAADGQVVEATYSNWGYGNTIVLDHGDGLTTRYAHMQADMRVKVGDSVSQNTALGRIGSTGWSTGNHLHFEVWQNGQALNPLLVLPDFTLEG